MLDAILVQTITNFFLKKSLKVAKSNVEFVGIPTFSKSLGNQNSTEVK